ncbi:hypothetical protein Ancab_034482, partial [Ancistrocladus abbreviatus]
MCNFQSWNALSRLASVKGGDFSFYSPVILMLVSLVCAAFDERLACQYQAANFGKSMSFNCQRDDDSDVA